MKVLIKRIRYAFSSGDPIEVLTFPNVTNIRQDKGGYLAITDNSGTSSYDRVIEIQVWP